MGKLLVALLLAALSGASPGFSGTWDATVELLPNPHIYENELVLKYPFALGWRI